MKPLHLVALLALVAAGCGGGEDRAGSRNEAGRLMALSDRWVAAAGPAIVASASHLTRSFNECSLVRIPGPAELPSEAELWPEWPAATYQAAGPFYAEFARQVGRLGLRDESFVPLESATAQIAAYLRRFRHVHPDTCATLRKWAKVGFDRPFDVGGAIGVPPGAFARGARPPDSLRAAEAAVRRAKLRMTQLGFPETAVRRFWLGADPLLYAATR